MKRIKEGFEVFTEGFANPEVVAALAYNRDFFTPLLSAMNEKIATIEITGHIQDGAVQIGATRLSSIAFDRESLKDISKNSQSFLSRVPPYIRGLFDDQK